MTKSTRTIKRIFAIISFSHLAWISLLPDDAYPSHHQSSPDPFAATAYRLAFDQRDIWAEFPEVLASEGLSHLLSAPGIHDREIERFISNLQEQPTYLQSLGKATSSLVARLSLPSIACCSFFRGAPANRVREISPLPTAWPRVQGMDDEEDDSFTSMLPAQTAEALNQRLMQHFATCKNNDALAASKERWGTCAAQTCCYAPLIPLAVKCPFLSFGGSVATLFIAQDASRIATESFLDWQKIQRYRKIDPWLTYELYYAIKKRFIPPSLWKEIEERFSLARSNPFLQEGIIKFLDIALNLPTRKVPLETLAEPQVGEMVRKIQQFFVDYEDDDRRNYALRAFIIAVKKQVEASADPAPSPDNYRRLIYLCGPGGMGKTRFVNELATILYGAEGKSKLVAIDLAGGSVESFFGSKTEPGSLLERLVRAPEETPGGDSGRRRFTNELLFMDEAGIALNNPQFVEEFKRLSEPSNGQFSPSYLPGFRFPMKDYLIIAAGNKPIEDPALRSRFIVVDFPHFNKDFLRSYLFQRLQQKVRGVLHEARSVDQERDFPVLGLSAAQRQSVETLLGREGLTIRDIEQSFDDILE